MGEDEKKLQDMEEKSDPKPEDMVVTIQPHNVTMDLQLEIQYRE